MVYVHNQRASTAETACARAAARSGDGRSLRELAWGPCGVFAVGAATESNLGLAGRIGIVDHADAGPDPGDADCVAGAAAGCRLCGAAPELTVHTAAGAVRGRLYDGCKVWRGVPFGAPPTGELRWRAPKTHDGWTGVRAAMEPAPQCPQLDVFRGEHFGQEDCLYLSVYAPPQCTRAQPCPTLFWIYGGAWSIGGNGEFGLYTGEHLALRHDVVIVAANYRLDVLGWIALDELIDESGSYSNYGLRDQRLALRWTRENVREFGGDPELITIFGESAGAFSVCQHLTSPASNGLFSRAIMESGGCSGPLLIQDGLNAKRFGDAYATAVGCARSSIPGERARCMRHKTPSEVMEPYISWLCPPWREPRNPWCNNSFLQDNVTAGGFTPGAPWRTSGALESQLQRQWPTTRPPLAPIAGWTAVVDGSPGGLLDTPARMMAEGRINKGPRGQPLQVMMGTNQDEMALFITALDLVVPGLRLPPQSEAFSALVQHVASYHDKWDNVTVARIEANYPRDFYRTEAYRLTRVGTDFCFRCDTRRAARALSRAGLDVYLYNFAYHFNTWRDPQSDKCQEDSEALCGVYHAAELRFVFDNYQFPLAEEDKEMAATIGALWSSFAKTGKPEVPSRFNTTDDVEWPLYNASSDRHLEINLPLTVHAGLSKAHCDLFEALPPEGPYPH